MVKLKKAVSVLLVISLVFSINIVSLAYPELRAILGDLFSINAYAVDSDIMNYAPSGTRDLAVDASVTASSSYTSGDGHWDIARINDGTMLYNGGANGYNGEAGFTSSPEEVYYNPNMSQAEKDAAVATSKTKPLSIDFDLEGFYDVSRVTLFRLGSFPDTFQIQTSTDGVNYSTVATKSGCAGFNGEAVSVDFGTSRARFVRVYVTVRGNLDGNYIHLVQLGEVAVFGKEVAATNSGLVIDSYAPENCINLAIDSIASATESYEEAEKWGVHNINDGDTQRNGGYTSEPANRAMHVDLDLGNVAELKRVVIFPNGVAPKAFEIQTSFDGITYKTVKTVTNSTRYPNSPMVYELSAPTFASYVRINVTERFSEDSYYVQFAELAVYGIKNAFDAHLNKSSLKMMVNDSIKLNLDVKNLNSFDPYNHNIVWSSSNTGVATVSSDGLVTAKAVGETTIKVENKTIGFVLEVKVNVYTSLPFARDEFTVSVFAPPTGNLFSDVHYKRLSEADVDLVLNTYNVYTKEDNLKLLELSGKYGMNAIVADMRFRTNTTTLSQSVIDEVYADYQGIGNLEGFYVYDEPWNANEYKNTVNSLVQKMSGGLNYLNFFPAFAYTSLEQYEYILEDWAAITNGNTDLMFDVYPFMADGTTNYNRLFDSLDAVRRAGLKYDVNTAGCVQTIGYGPVGGPLTNRIPYESDMLYQNMAYLAYGVKHVSYWKYSQETPNGMEDYEGCPIDENGNPTDVYYYMQRINPIVHTLGKTLINCDAKEVYITGSNTFGQLPVPSGFFVQPGNTSQSLIFSYLQDKTTGRNYLMVVNNNVSSSVTAPLKFASGISSIEILNNNTGAWTTSSVSGNYNVNLPAGGAALIALPSSYRYAGTAVSEPYKTNEFYHKTVSGTSSLGTPGTREQMMPGWYLNALTDGYIVPNAEKGINGWCSERKSSSFTTSVQIDLGAQQSISSVTLHAVDETTGYNGYFPKSYSISVSTNGTLWTQVASVTNSTTTDEVTHTFSSRNVRYVRVDVNAMNAIDGLYAAALAEIETNGIPQISDYKVVAEDVNGLYAYMRCENTTHTKFPTWTESGGQDDLIWHEGEAGRWIVDGKMYNYRAYIPVSNHKNEHGTYIVHFYAYNSFTETSKGATFNFDLKLSFDLNYGNIPKNLMNGLSNIAGGSGVTATYNASEDSVTLNGTLQGSINLQTQVPIDVDLKKGDTLRVIVEEMSGSMSNGIIVIELFDDNLRNPDGRRHVADIVNGGVYDIPITTDKAASDISSYKFWLYKSEKTNTFNNYKFRIKLEVYNGTAPVHSPSGKNLAYMELAGTLPTPTRDDADFLGWFTHENNQVFPDTPNTITNALTLYAHWAPHPINLNFDKNIPSGATPTSASNMPSASKITYNSAFTLPSTVPQMTGYIFKGWATTPNVVSGETVYQPGASIPAATVNTFFNTANGVAKIYARWTPITYTVRFRGNGNNGGADVASHTMTYDVATKLNLNTYTRTGYTFNGWNIASNGSAESFTDGQTVKNLTYENGKEVNLYAQWTVNKYTIVFDGNGSTGGSMSNLEMSYDIAKNLTANAFSKNGAVFEGWNTKPDGTGTSYSDKQSVSKLSATNGATVTLYAMWSSNPEVIFGNEFDFDKFYYSNYVQSASGYSEKSPDFVVQDKVNNALTITATDKATDSYTIPYDNPGGGATSLYALNLIPGRTYEFSCKYENLRSNAAPVRIMTFFYDNPNLTSFGNYAYNTVHKAINGNSTGTFTATFTVPEGRPYMTFRFGLCNKGDVQAGGSSVRFSEICVRDVTNFADTPVKDDVTKTSVLSKISTPDNGYTVSDFPTLTRTGYTFLGWSTERDNSSGNGVASKRVDSYTFSSSELNSGKNVTLYPIWASNVVVAQFKTGIDSVPDFAQNFYYGEAQQISSVEGGNYTVKYYNGSSKYNLDQTVNIELLGWSLSEGGSVEYTPSQSIINPNGLIGKSNDPNAANAVRINLYAKWKTDGVSVTTPFVKQDNCVLAGWSETQGSTVADYAVGATITPTRDMNLYAVWISLSEVQNKIDSYDEAYSEEKTDIVSGIVINPDGSASPYSEIKASGHLKYDRTAFDKALEHYEEAKDNFADKNSASNNALVSAIREVEGLRTPTKENGMVKDYLSTFEIAYAKDVTGDVPAGKYSVADMNLNHYSLANLDSAKNALEAGSRASAQSDINKQVVNLANAFVNKEDVMASEPVYNVYETADAIKNSGLISSENITAMSYVYTGKGNYTYYCYTNSKTPTMLVSVDEVITNGRACYPTSADVISSSVTLNAVSGSKVLKKTASDATDYSDYFSAGMGTKLTESYYSRKDVVQLTPDFTNAGDKATVSYTIKAHDDAFAKTAADINYADSANLASGDGKGNLAEIPDTSVTPENTITIIIDYHLGEKMNVEGEQVGEDKWLKQYHLTRTADGASNWDFASRGDSVYTVDDPIYGQTNFGSFTYTFKVGSSNDFANCVLSSKDLEAVRKIVSENFDAVSSVPLTASKTTTRFAHKKDANGNEILDENGKPIVYVETVPAGTGLGFKAWPSGWSFNYYPASKAYTYVHLVDRWGNSVDKIIEVPDVDANAVALLSQSAGDVTVVETGGSGIETMSFSAKSFDIIADENSTFDGETYSTTGNTIKVYTGEANKKYTLTANDSAENKNSASVSTDADGYLIITVEDKVFDSQSGAYTFMLNDMEIRLYAEVEEESSIGVVTNVEYTPSVSTRNEFMFTVTRRPDKIQVIEPDGGTRTYDRYHTKVSIESFDANGNKVDSMSRELSYEVWTIEMNVPADKELTAIARYGREWSKNKPYKYTVVLAEPEFDDEVYSMALAADEGQQGKVSATVVTGLDVQGVRFVMDNNTTTTYYFATQSDSTKKTFVGNAWMNHAGDNVITVKIRVNNKWIEAGKLNYNAY